MQEFELRHYEECEDQEKDNHIYNDVITLQKFIETWGLLKIWGVIKGPN